MRIRYLGTAAAEGFPAVFCNCDACVSARKNLQTELRTRSQALIDKELLIDFPPESYLHAVRFGIDFSAVRHLLVTHSHTDHFYAQEFVNRGYKFAKDMVAEELHIYGNAEVLAVYEESARREMRDEVRCNIRLHEVHPFMKLKAGEYEVFTLPAVHTPKEEALLYCIRKAGKTLLYLNDTGLPCEECYSFLSENGIRVDFVSLDCTFADDQGKHSLRHMGFVENEIVRQKLTDYSISDLDTKYYVTHFSHNSSPFHERIEMEAGRRGFTAAYDGLEIEV